MKRKYKLIDSFQVVMRRKRRNAVTDHLEYVTVIAKDEDKAGELAKKVHPGYRVDRVVESTAVVQPYLRF